MLRSNVSADQGKGRGVGGERERRALGEEGGLGEGERERRALGEERLVHLFSPCTKNTHPCAHMYLQRYTPRATAGTTCHDAEVVTDQSGSGSYIHTHARARAE